MGRSNYEFLLYVAVILVVAGLILFSQPRIRFGPPVLWGLTVWGFLHMAGGNVAVGDGVLYGMTLVPIVERVAPDGEPFVLLRYDQLVHTFGFGVATLVMHHLLRPQLRPARRTAPSLFIMVILIGCGVGAANEVIEFAAVLIFPETGVGGYYNTALDLVFNLLGATLAATWLAVRGTLVPES
jgi:uncharacterized membrane protein YjdF